MTGIRKNRRGVTLVEVAVSTTLVGVVLVAALETVGGAARMHLRAASAAEAWTLAERYAAEIMAKAYEDPEGSVVFGTESNDGVTSVRDDLDDVDDYHNWYESPPQTAAGVDRAAYNGWSVEVIVTRCDADPSGATIADIVPDEGLKRIQVRVTDADGRVVEYEALRSKYGAGQYETPLGQTQVESLTVDFAVAGAPAQTAGDQHLNEAPTP